MTKIRVTVIMPAYNAGKYLKEAIESLLTQTYSDFILLIINDGSDDNTEKIILSYLDTRIKYVRNDKNIGLVATLNKGVNMVDTEYIVRMDADDIALPQRLKWQVEFMDRNPDIGVSGGLYAIFGDENGIPKTPLDDGTIKASLLFDNVICHPSIILRTELLKKHRIFFGVPFDFNDPNGHKILELEDYALWHKLKSITRFANLDKVLIRYRREGQNLTSKKADLIFERKKQYYLYLLNEINISPTENNLLTHISLKNISKYQSQEGVFLFKSHLEQIINNNIKMSVYPQKELVKMVNQKWNQLFYHLPSIHMKYVFAYWKCDRKINFPHFLYFIKHTFNKILRRTHSFD